MLYFLAVLDFMGTICDQENDHFISFQKAVEKILQTRLDARTIVGLPGAVGGGDEAVVRCILTHLGIPYTKELAEKLLEEKARIFDERIKGKPLQVRQGSLEAIRWLHEQKITCAIATNSRREKVMPMIDTLGLTEWIPQDLIVCAGDVSTRTGKVLGRKPDPDIVIEATWRANVSPWQSIMFDDSVRGMAAARAAGTSRVAMANFDVESLIQGLKAEEPLAVMLYHWNLPVLQQLFGR